jgi:hypothetical protein
LPPPASPSRVSRSASPLRQASVPVRSARKTSGAGGIVFSLFTLLIIGATAYGWVNRDALGLTPEQGAGYWLGIAGMSCVGLLLIYPLRKRAPKLAFIGSVPAWFHLHMALGLLAPILILYHATFRTGSVNAQIALTAMLIVAGSGVVGRLIYVRVHKGLTGQKREVRSLALEAAQLRQTFMKDFAQVADIAESLESTLRVAPTNVFSALAYALGASSRISRAQNQMLKAIRRGSTVVSSRGSIGLRSGVLLRKNASALVREYCRTLKGASYLTFFERLFSLWHVMHLPLFALMVVAAVIHVVAVHLY